MADLQGSAFFIIFNETNQKMKPKTPFTVFFELHPDTFIVFSMFVRIVRDPRMS